MSKSARRTLTLLNHIAEAPTPLMLMEVARQAELDKSTTSRLLADLVDAGLVERDPRTRSYHLGAQAIALAGSIARNADFRFLPRTRLEAIRDLTGESVMIQMRSGNERVVVEGVEGAHPMRRVVPLGERHPLILGQSSRALLSMLPDDEVDAICAELLVSAEQRAVIDDGIATIRRQGYQAQLSDSTLGVCVLTAPLPWTATVGSVACITISGPMERWTLEHAEAMAEQVLGLISAPAATDKAAG
jgi:DNA-binding IclR family transcriptional regulator